MSRRTLFVVALALGAVMVALGVFIALRLLLSPGRSFTGQVWLDAAFAVFFVVRGAMHVARVRRQRGE